MVELLLLLLPLLLLPWFGPERRAGRTVGRAGGAASFAFGGNGARKLSKACNTFVSPLRCTWHSHATHRGALVPCGVAWRRCNAIFGNQAPCGEQGNQFGQLRGPKGGIMLRTGGTLLFSRFGAQWTL